LWVIVFAILFFLIQENETQNPLKILRKSGISPTNTLKYLFYNRFFYCPIAVFTKKRRWLWARSFF